MVLVRYRFKDSIVSSPIMSNLNCLLNCQLRCNNLERILRVVERHVSGNNLIIIKYVFWEETLQVHGTLINAAICFNGEVLLLGMVLKKLAGLLMDHDCLLVLDLSVIMVDDFTGNGVADFNFWSIFILPRFLLPVARSWNVIGECKLEGDHIISRLESTLVKLVQISFKFEIFSCALWKVMMSSLFRMGGVMETSFLLTFDVNL